MNYKSLVSLFLIVLILGSCNDDEGNDPKKLMLNLKILDRISTGKSYIIISDDEGEILTSTSISNYNDYKLISKENYLKNTINITIANISDKGDIFCFSYLGVKKGASWVLTGFGERSQQKKVYINFKEPREFSYLKISSTSDEISLNEAVKLEHIGQQSLNYDEGSKLLVELTHQDKIYYDFIEINNTQLDINLSNLKEYKKSAFYCSPQSYLQYTLSGIENHNGKDTYYPLRRLDNKEEGTLFLYYPENVFAKYRFNLSFNLDNNKYFRHTSIGGVPSSFNMLDVDAKIIDGRMNHFEVETTGVFDFHETEFSNLPLFGNGTKPYRWTVSAPAYIKSYKLPDIDGIIGNVDFSDKIRLRGFTITDYSNYTDNGKDYALFSEMPRQFEYEKSTSIFWDIF